MISQCYWLATTRKITLPAKSCSTNLTLRSGVVIKRELSLDNFAADIDVEVTEVAPVDFVYVNPLVMVATFKDNATSKGHFVVYAFGQGLQNQPGSIIAQNLKPVASGSVDQTFICAIELVQTK